MSRPTSLRWLLVSLLLLTPSLAATADAPLGAATGPVHAADLYVPGELVVKLAPGGDLAALSELNARFLVRSVEPLFPEASYDLGRIYRLRVARGLDLWHLALRYARHPLVVWAEPNLRARPMAPPNDPLLRSQYNLHNVGQTGGLPDADVDAAQALQFYLANPPAFAPVVAILDTGVELDHPDLVGRVLDGYDFLNDDDDPSDTDGHGTGTASVVAAEMDNGVGIAGLCPNCMIRPVRVGAWVVHFGSVEVAEGIVYAADPAQGAADVVSMSLGGTCSDLWTDAVDYAHDQDVLLVAAAGTYTPVVVYPAGYPRVMSIGATDDEDRIPLWVPRIGPIDLYAPGDAVPVAELNGLFGTMSGTSSATPHVAATAALLLGQNPTLTTAELRQIIEQTADPRGGFFNPFLRLNTDRAIRQAQTPPPTPSTRPRRRVGSCPCRRASARRSTA